MAQDETYQTEVYHEQGGHKEVVTSGGIVEVQSGGTIDISASGILNIQSGAAFNALSGGSMNLESDFAFFFGSNMIAANRMINYLMGRGAVSIITTTLTKLSAMGGSSPPVLPSRQGYIFFSFCTGSATQVSCRLHSAYIGEELIIMMRGEDAGAYISIKLSGGDGLSGVSVQGYSNNASILSCIMMYNSASCYPRLKLLGVADGTWAIVDATALSSDGTGGTADVIVEQVE